MLCPPVPGGQAQGMRPSLHGLSKGAWASSRSVSGRPVYDIGSPIFDEVKLNLAGGKVFTITARKVSAANKHVQSAKLNGKPLNQPRFEHSDMVNGGTLVLEMGPHPNTAWGSAPEAAPPSMSR